MHYLENVIRKLSGGIKTHPLPPLFPTPTLTPTYSPSHPGQQMKDLFQILSNIDVILVCFTLSFIQRAIIQTILIVRFDSTLQRYETGIILIEIYLALKLNQVLNTLTIPQVKLTLPSGEFPVLVNSSKISQGMIHLYAVWWIQLTIAFIIIFSMAF